MVAKAVAAVQTIIQSIAILIPHPCLHQPPRPADISRWFETPPLNVIVPGNLTEHTDMGYLPHMIDGDLPDFPQVHGYRVTVGTFLKLRLVFVNVKKGKIWVRVRVLRRNPDGHAS
jgi:hypothetical protein